MRPAPMLGGVATAVTLAYAAAFSSRTQVFGDFPYAGPADANVVALTFDDGPNEPYTSRLLDTLDERDVRATFFQVGRCAERHPDTTRRLVQTGHVLGNHSQTHTWTSYLTHPRQRDEIRRAQDVLHRIADVVPALYRPPWLCHWPWVLRSVADAGLQVVSGTFGSPWEVAQPAAKQIESDAARRARPGTILILHDGREGRGGPRESTVAAVGGLVDRLRDRGYSFTTVDRLLSVPAYR